jgi:hypothetical protein
MSSGLSVVANIAQILDFGVQLVQAGPDLVGLVPGFIRDVCRFARERLSALDEDRTLNSELIPCDAGPRDDAFALEEGRVGEEQALTQSSIHRQRTW